MNEERRVVITGLGMVSPLGIGASVFWDALIERRSGIGPITRFDPSGLPSRIAGEVPPFKIGDFIPKTHRKSVKLMSRDIELAVAAAHGAAADAKLPTRCLIDRGEIDAPHLDPTRLGANIGAGLIGPELTDLSRAFCSALDDSGNFDLGRWGREGMENLTPLWMLKFLPNMPACHVTIVHDARAATNTITCGEASGHLAVGEAYRNIARGAMDVCICGGAESKLNPMGIARPALMQRLVTDCEDAPATACRPFARNRRGTVTSEGAGLLILESIDHARNRDARIYAEVAGFGTAGNIQSWLGPDADGSAIALALSKALKDAETQPNQVDLACTFGCGTAEHDRAELLGWKTVLGSHADGLPALAVKGSVGNNGAGSGAIDLCAAVLALHHNTIPPSLNTDPPDDACSFRFAQDDPLDARIDRIASVAYALGGGQNAALIIKRFED